LSEGATARSGLLGLVVPVRGGLAGNAGDASATTFCFATDNRDVQLVATDGTPIEQSLVPGVYGTDDGMTVYVDGVDVTSAGYAGKGGPKTPLGMDLSDAAGWPNIAVPSGRLAVDPVLGRFAFHAGGNPYLVSSWDPDDLNGHDGVFVQGQYAYITDWVTDRTTRGMDIVDISDPAHPRRVAVAVFGEGGQGMDVIVEGSYAYVTAKSGGLYIFDVSDPSNPQYKSRIQADPNEDDLALHLFKVGNLVYVADEKFGVVIYNVSNPSHPSKVGVCPIGFAESVWVEGRYAYIAGGTNGLHIYDVSTPSAPVLKGVFYVEGTYIYDVQVVGNYAYITGRPYAQGLRVIDVSDPTNPHQVGAVATAAEAYDIRIANGCAYIAERQGSKPSGYLEVFDLSSPTQPVLLKRYASPGQSSISGVYPQGTLVYLAAHGEGLLVVNPNISEAPEGTVTVDYNWEDNSLTATPSPVPSPTATVDPSLAVTLTIQVNLQGRGAAPSSRWRVPLLLELRPPQGSTVQRADIQVANEEGKATFAGILQGDYDVYIHGDTTLVNVLRNQHLAAGERSLSLGTLYEGDANQDDRINILDFAILASAYGETAGGAHFDPRADFNDDGRINILDFSLLASNYGLSGPREVAGH
ncbi:MAG: hypothetical protein J7M05_01460, partial [Anaerolineae bacterium]|nr:hypothetical protein [Anaerolineae bacterium]